ncbi:MAG TPA: aminoacyl-tRNA hydrolase [Kiloniellales bacterium]
MLLLVGLGNPGPRYAGNRHNIGYMAVDEIVRRHGFGPWRGRFQGHVCEGRMGGVRLLALKPETYMNESGRSVGEALRFYKLAPAALLVFHDDLDLRLGKVKVKQGGGPGGHNGLRSIDAHIGRDYRRVRLGIGHPGHKDLVHPYVLKDFSKDEAKTVAKLVDAVAGELPKLIAGDEGAFMSRIAHLMAPPKPLPKAREKTPAATAMNTQDGPPAAEDAETSE